MSEDQEILLWSVNPEQEGHRIDKVVTSPISAWTRMMVQAWIRGGRVMVNGQKVKTNYRLSSGEEVKIWVHDVKLLGSKLKRFLEYPI